MAPDEDLPEQPSLTPAQITRLFDYSEFAEAIETKDFKQLLDHIPIAVLISRDVNGVHRIIYTNSAFEALLRQPSPDMGRPVPLGHVLDSLKHEDQETLTLRKALELEEDKQFVGTFRQEVPKPLLVEAYASIIENADGTESYRIFAFIDVTARSREQREQFSRRLREKEALLLELQHRVKNNLQLITAMIRLEARYQREGEPVNLARLAGRIEALQLLYRDLSPDPSANTVDLGHYLSQIASAVMHAYAIDGIQLDLKVDHAVASINVAMPVGLIVNELMTNAFKYAFAGRESGTMQVRCLHAGTDYQIVVADDGAGLPEGMSWPMPGKLSAVIFQTLRENARNAAVTVETSPEKGTRVTIGFQHEPTIKKLQ